MIQIVPCTGCRRSFVLPTHVSMEATIECAHCGKQFVVGEMLESELGSWKVICDPAAEQAREPAGLEEVVNEADRSEVLVGVQNADHSRELKLAEAEAPAAAKPKTDWSDFKPVTHDQFERMKRKSRSPIWSILQVVLGGVAAVPIALLLLWHVLDRDVGGAGPWVGKFAPWIVPEKYRPVDDESFSTARQAPRDRGESGFRNFDGVMPIGRDEREMDEQGENESRPPDSDLRAMEGAEMSGQGGNPGGLSMSGNADNETDSQAIDPESSSEETLNIFMQIRQCHQDLDAWNVAVREPDTQHRKDTLKRLAQSVYGDLAELSATIAELPSDTPIIRRIRDAMQPISRDIKRRADVQKLIQQGARFWTRENTDSVDYSLATIVEIESVTEEQEEWRVVPTGSSDSSAEFDFRVPRYIAPTLIPGQRLFLLGTVTEEKKSVSEAPSRPLFQACYLHAL